MADFLTTGSADAAHWIAFAPGAGAPVTSPWMGRMAELLAEGGLYVLRFEFAYRAARRPPPRAERLVGEYEAAVGEILARAGAGRGLLIGGKSLGGRVASLAAGPLFAAGRIAGLLCLGYPFHPPKLPEALRTAHLKTLACPALIVQGERDPFGGRGEVESYGLSPAITLHWAADGDHDLKPRRASGATLEGNLAEAAGAITRFARGLR